MRTALFLVLALGGCDNVLPAPDLARMKHPSEDRAYAFEPLAPDGRAMAAKSAKAAHGALGSHVNIRPQGIESADLEHAEVKRSKLPADLLKPSPLT